MKKIFIFALLTTLFVGTSDAVVVQKVFLKNGTVLNGYIQQQDNDANITFRSDDAVICIKGNNAVTTERVYKYSELGQKWKDWAEKNDAFNGTGDARTLTLNEIMFKPQNTSGDDVDSVAVDEEEKGGFEDEFVVRHSNITKVKVLEKGVNIKYLELTPNTYTFKWSDVERIVADKRPKTLLSGIDRVYQLEHGQEVSGQYAGESENTLSLYTSSGMKETFDIDKVSKYFFKPINPNQSIFEQSELIDVIQTKNQGSYRGVIVERNFTAGNNYLVIMQQAGSSQMVKFADVIRYSKEENTDYKPKFDIILKQGEVVINRVATDSVGVSRRGSTLVLDSINNNVVINKEQNSTKVVVEYYNPQHLSSDHLILVGLDKAGSAKKPVYSFSTDIYEMRKFSAICTETSVNNTTRIEYVLPDKGVYAIYDQTTRKAMPFIIK